MRRYTDLSQHDNDVLNMLFLKRVMVYAGKRAREYNSTVGGSAPKTVGAYWCGTGITIGVYLE